MSRHRGISNEPQKIGSTNIQDRSGEMGLQSQSIFLEHLNFIVDRLEDEGTPRKRKTTGSKRIGFETAFAKVMSVNERISSEVDAILLSTEGKGIEVSKMTDNVVELEREVTNLSGSVNDVLQLGNDLISEIQAEEDYPPDYLNNVTEKVSSMESSLSEIQEKLQATKDRLQFEKWKNRCQSQISSLNSILNTWSALLEELKTEPGDPEVRKRDLESRRSSFESCASTVEEIKRLANSTTFRSDNESSTAIRKEIESICSRWSDISESLKTFKLDKDLCQHSQEKSKDLNGEIDNLVSKLEKLANTYKAFDTGCNVEDEVLESKRESLASLSCQFEAMEAVIIPINEKVALLSKDASHPSLQMTKTRLSNFNLEFEKTRESVLTLLESTIRVIDCRRDMKTDLVLLHDFIDQLPAVSIQFQEPLHEPSQLSQKTFKLLKLKEDVEAKRELYEKVTSANQFSPTFKRQLHDLETKWNSVCHPIVTKYYVLKTASDEYGEFKSLAAQEADWLERLEEKLLKSTNTAADAEEISEELDDIENFLNNHQGERQDRMKDLVRSLRDKEILTDAIFDEASKLEVRWNTLAQQAVERTAVLEGSIAEAQEWEYKLIAVQDWLQERDLLLSSHLEHELTAEDFLPDKAQVIFSSLCIDLAGIDITFN